MRTLTPSEAVTLLKQRVLATGSQADFANKTGIQQSVLNQTMQGKRSMSDRVAASIGLEKQIIYVPRQPKKKAKK